MQRNYIQKLFFSKKASLAVAVVIVIALFIIFAQIISLSKRECSFDRDCASDSYCGSDYQCHKYPVITETNYVPAALIIGISLIIAAVILRWKKQALNH